MDPQPSLTLSAFLWGLLIGLAVGGLLGAGVMALWRAGKPNGG